MNKQKNKMERLEEQKHIRTGNIILVQKVILLYPCKMGERDPQHRFKTEKPEVAFVLVGTHPWTQGRLQGPVTSEVTQGLSLKRAQNGYLMPFSHHLEFLLSLAVNLRWGFGASAPAGLPPGLPTASKWVSISSPILDVTCFSLPCSPPCILCNLPMGGPRGQVHRGGLSIHHCAWALGRSGLGAHTAPHVLSTPPPRGSQHHCVLGR